MKICRVRDEEWEGLVYDDGHESRERLPLGDPTPEEYAELCDDQAENENMHDFCGVHAALLKVLRDNVASPKALDGIMRTVAENGGLQGMA